MGLLVALPHHLLLRLVALPALPQASPWARLVATQRFPLAHRASKHSSPTATSKRRTSLIRPAGTAKNSKRLPSCNAKTRLSHPRVFTTARPTRCRPSPTRWSRWTLASMWAQEKCRTPSTKSGSRFITAQCGSKTPHLRSTGLRAVAGLRAGHLLKPQADPERRALRQAASPVSQKPR